MGAIAALKVPRLADVSPRRFHEEIVPASQPVVLEQAAAHWALVRHAQHDHAACADYLRKRATAHRATTFVAPASAHGRFGYTDDLGGLNFDRLAWTLAHILNTLVSPAQDTAHYAGALPLGKYFPALSGELPWSVSDSIPSAQPFLWIGGRCRVGAHYDSPHNLACVAAGRRRFTLFPTDQVANLYVGPIDFTPAGQAMSLVDFHSPDWQRYPRFRDACQHALVADLAPGDVLFIPAMWWHHVESLDDFNVLVNYWWPAGDPCVDDPLTTMIHALLSLRHLPPAQRQAWRSLFDHYIFQHDLPEHSLEHLPERSHGVLGALDPSQALRQHALVAERLALPSAGETTVLRGRS
ncbi:MAG: cupin-like domain-containing protein [Pseudomonadota bacterium]